jgi:hypothetical protein
LLHEHRWASSWCITAAGLPLLTVRYLTRQTFYTERTLCPMAKRVKVAPGVDRTGAFRCHRVAKPRQKVLRRLLGVPDRCSLAGRP